MNETAFFQELATSDVMSDVEITLKGDGVKVSHEYESSNGNYYEITVHVSTNDSEIIKEEYRVIPFLKEKSSKYIGLLFNWHGISKEHKSFYKVVKCFKNLIEKQESLIDAEFIHEVEEIISNELTQKNAAVKEPVMALISLYD